MHSQIGASISSHITGVDLPVTTLWPGKRCALDLELQGVTTAEIVLAGMPLAEIAVATFATGGAALVATALAVGILAGVAAGGVGLSLLIIDEIGTANPPTFDKFLLNTTSKIKWTGASLLL
jgi:hypothetical protein